jgi:hypothetical protein
LTPAQIYTSDYDAVASDIYWWTYSIRPDGVASQSYPNGFKWILIRSQYTHLYENVNFPANTLPAAFAGVYQTIYPEAARLAMWYVRQRCQQLQPTGFSVSGAWIYRYIMEDPTIPESSPGSLNLPLSVMFGDGRYDFKSGWDPNGSTNTNWAVRFHTARYHTLTDGRGPQLYIGHYEIHRKGPQTIQRGSGGHIPIWHGALNRLYFRDITFVPPYMDTGNNSWAIRQAGRSLDNGNPAAVNRGNDIFPGSQADYYTEKRDRLASGAVDMDYVYEDLVKHWPSAAKYSTQMNPPIVTTLIDQKVLFRPPNLADSVVVVIFVRYVTTSSIYEPIYCWNPAGPSISVDGSETANQPVRWLTGFGNWTYTGASRAICVNTQSEGSPAHNGKNILTVIRPTGRTIIKSGGPNEAGQRLVGGESYPGAWPEVSAVSSCESIDYYGQRYVHYETVGQDGYTHHGEFFIQVQPNPMTTAGDYLLVNEVGDSTITPAVCDALTGTNGFVGVAIQTPAKRIAVFNTGGDVTSGTFTVPTAGTYKAQICSLSGTTRTVTVSSGSVTDVATGGSSPFTVDASKSLYLNLTGLSAGATVTIS